MAEQTKTGGPAFPCHADIIPSKYRDYAGMTLRDYFAAKAPEGYMAVECAECYGCEFSYIGQECLGAACGSSHRKDGCYVIFVKRDGKATASWPYDSEGTPVEVPHA